MNSSSEEEVEEPRRKRRRRGRENTESSSVQECLDSSESDETDTDLFAEDSDNEDLEGFSNRSFQWREPVGEINPPPACKEPTGPKIELPEEASAMQFFSTQTSSNMLFVKRTDLLNKAKLKQVKETHFGVTLWL